MIVTIEGLDCSGKSWLADEIASDFMLTRFDNSFRPHTADYTDPSSSWVDVVMGMNVVTAQAYDSFDNFVKDRFFMSEYVYSKFYKRPMRIPYKELYERGRDKNILVYVDVSYDVHVEIASKKCELAFTRAEYDAQKALYNEAFEKADMKNKCIVYNARTAEDMRAVAAGFIEDVIDGSALKTYKEIFDEPDD